VRSVEKLLQPFADVPIRSRRVPPEVRLIDVFGEDVQLTGLCRFLFRTFDVVTIGELDAAGWKIVNSYSGKLARKKRDLFFRTIGRPEINIEASTEAGRVVPFRRSSLG
jgi:hypothetical protein